MVQVAAVTYARGFLWSAGRKQRKITQEEAGPLQTASTIMWACKQSSAHLAAPLISGSLQSFCDAQWGGLRSQGVIPLVCWVLRVPVHPPPRPEGAQVGLLGATPGVGLGDLGLELPGHAAVPFLSRGDAALQPWKELGGVRGNSSSAELPEAASLCR